LVIGDPLFFIHFFSHKAHGTIAWYSFLLLFLQLFLRRGRWW
jgi:hypothetical protein